MVKQKLGLKFTEGLFIGIIMTMLLMSVVIDKMFVSKDVFTLKKNLCKWKNL